MAMDDFSATTELVEELLDLDGQQAFSLLEDPDTHRAGSLRDHGRHFFGRGRCPHQARRPSLSEDEDRAISEDGSEVTVIDPVMREARTMLNFASNSYLGLGKHPEVPRPSAMPWRSMARAGGLADAQRHHRVHT